MAFTSAQIPILSELLIPGKCFIFITSSAFPNGELYSWLTPMVDYTVAATGLNENPSVGSANFALAFISFDYGSKTFSIATKTNLTASAVTGMQVFNGADQTLLCEVDFTVAAPFNYYVSNWCQVNATDIPAVASGQVSINYLTTTHPTGELRGMVIPAGFTAGASSLALGLGVGLGVGIPVVAAAGVGIFFLVKKVGHMSSSSKI